MRLVGPINKEIVRETELAVDGENDLATVQVIRQEAELQAVFVQSAGVKQDESRVGSM